MSPYIVTTKRDITGLGYKDYDTEVSRRAVATLDEAREAIIDAAPEENIGKPAEVALLAAEITNLPEQGGAVTLPDGTVIEVQPMPIRGGLLTMFNLSPWKADRMTDDQIIAAFNEAQGGPR